VLRHVGLFEERYRQMGTYSTGMKQRVKLAQALVHDPLIAFLDEPTAGLDPLGRREMLELIRRVGGEFGISIVISTHLMGDVERACDSVVVGGGGRPLPPGARSRVKEGTETRGGVRGGGGAPGAHPRGARGVETRIDGNRLTLEGVSGEGYDALRDAIVESGALLYRLAPARHSLADVFVGGSDDPPAQEPAT
jgi:ABC-2 type transport system ATP-binding protein